MLFFIIVQELELREHQTLMIHESARKSTDNTRNEAWVNGLWKKICSKKQLSRD